MIRDVTSEGSAYSSLPRPAASAAVHTTIVIPVYNEEQALPIVLGTILDVVGQGYEVLVVDDGSHDRSVEVAKSFPCTIVQHASNGGKGKAMMTGIAHAKGAKVIFIDGDATYPAEAIPQVVQQLNSYDVVRCVRHQGRGNIPLLNRLGNEFFDRLIKSLHRVEGADMLSGLYGLHKRHLEAMKLESHGFDIETEIMVKAGAMELSSTTIPIEYNERVGEKKLRPLRDGLRILRRVFKLAVILNPSLVYLLPGLLLSALGAGMLLQALNAQALLPAFGLSTHAMLISAMAILAGLQVVILGSIGNLYAAQLGLARVQTLFGWLASRLVRQLGFFVGLGTVLVGLVWLLLLGWGSLMVPAEAAARHDAFVVALALVVWGVQLVITSLFLSMFAWNTNRTPVTREPVLELEEQAVGGTAS